MYLCHKCSGTFEIVEGLNSCQCMSGYYRGFEKDVTFEQAATLQAIQEIEWLALYLSQGRTKDDQSYLTALERLKVAMKSSPAFGHGVVDWNALATTKSWCG
jgi:hypothetical protein